MYTQQGVGGGVKGRQEGGVMKRKGTDDGGGSTERD